MGPHRDKGNRSKKWRVDYYSIIDSVRTRRKKYFKHKEAAAEFERMEAEKDERRKAGLGYTEAKDFESLLHEFISRHLVGKSTEYVRVIKGRLLNLMLPYFKGRMVHEVTSRDIEDYLNLQRLKKHAGTTLFHHHTLLKTLFKKAIEWRYCDVNPVEMVSKPKKVQKRVPCAKTELELRRFLNECGSDIRYAVLILLHTGIRMGELFMLSKSDFDLDHGFLILKSYEGHTTKNNQHRQIPLSPVVQEVLRKMPNGPVMQMARKTFEKHFLDAARRANVKITPHELRHTYCSMLLKAGIKDLDVSIFLGHGSTVMTRRYSHHIPGHYETIKDKMSFGLDFARDKPGTNVVELVAAGGKKR